MYGLDKMNWKNLNFDNIEIIENQDPNIIKQSLEKKDIEDLILKNL